MGLTLLVDCLLLPRFLNILVKTLISVIFLVITFLGLLVVGVAIIVLLDDDNDNDDDRFFFIFFFFFFWWTTTVVLIFAADLVWLLLLLLLVIFSSNLNNLFVRSTLLFVWDRCLRIICASLVASLISFLEYPKFIRICNLSNDGRFNRVYLDDGDEGFGAVDVAVDDVDDVDDDDDDDNSYSSTLLYDCSFS